MKTIKNKFPEKKVQHLYHFKKEAVRAAETTTSECSDPTTTCGTVFTTTHLK